MSHRQIGGMYALNLDLKWVGIVICLRVNATKVIHKEEKWYWCYLMLWWPKCCVALWCTSVGWKLELSDFVHGMKYRKYKRSFNAILFRGSEHNPPYSITFHTALGRLSPYFQYIRKEKENMRPCFIQPNLMPSTENGERSKFKYYCSSTNARYMEIYWGWLADIQRHSYLSKWDVASCWHTWTQTHWE